MGAFTPVFDGLCPAMTERPTSVKIRNQPYRTTPEMNPGLRRGGLMRSFR